MAGAGIELPQRNGGNSTIEDKSGAECGALERENAPIDPELAVVAEAWPTLPAALKAGILAMVRAAK